MNFKELESKHVNIITKVQQTRLCVAELKESLAEAKLLCKECKSKDDEIRQLKWTHNKDKIQMLQKMQELEKQVRSTETRIIIKPKIVDRIQEQVVGSSQLKMVEIKKMIVQEAECGEKPTEPVNYLKEEDSVKDDSKSVKKEVTTPVPRTSSPNWIL